MSENPFLYFDMALDAIARSGHRPSAELAERTLVNLGPKDKALRINDNPPRLRTLTSFALLAVPGAVQQYSPTIIIDQANPYSRVEDTRFLEADLIRTLAIRDQFFFGGFEGPLNEAYGRALSLQIDWLDHARMPRVELDPRKIRPEVLIEQILGSVRYRLDIGFRDWQSTIDQMLQDPQHNRDWPVLEMLRPNKSHFIAQRHIQQPSSYQQIEEEGLRPFLSREEEAELFCEMLVINSLSTFPRSDLHLS